MNTSGTAPSSSSSSLPASPSLAAGAPSNDSSNQPTLEKPTSAFERWRRKAMLVTGLGVTEDERMEDLRASQIAACEKKKEYLMNYSPIVVFMLKHLKASGCAVPASNVLCAPCEKLQAGGFTPDPGAVVLCAGAFFSEQHMESTITHELIHMYDHCRFKVDWNNLRHHACSEIRANSLSGDCRFTRELRRGNVAFSKQHQACVRTRAITSVAANPACPDQASAERAVNEVWESCFSDTRPFDEELGGDVDEFEDSGCRLLSHSLPSKYKMSPATLVDAIDCVSHRSSFFFSSSRSLNPSRPPITTCNMFSKLSLLALAAPLMVSALQIAIPENPTNSGTITIKWTNEPNDPDTWSFELINTVFNNAFAIANNINPSASSITLTLPVVPVGAGYTIEAVNIGNITDVFAQTGSFSIGAATTTLASSSATASSASASHSGSASSIKSTGSASATVSVPTSNVGFSTNIVSPTPTAPATTGSVSGSGTPSGSSTGGNAAITPFSAASRITSIGGSAGGFAAVLLSAIAGAAMITL